MSELSGQYPLSDLLECAGLARSSYYCALSHPKAPTRPELWEAAAEIFSRTANGCGHRQIAMCLRAERGAVSVNIIFTIFTNVFSPIAPTRMRRIRQRGCATFGA